MAVRTRRKRTFTVAQYQPLICQASRGAGGDKRLSLTAGLPTHHSVPLRHKEEDISPPPACIASPLYLNTLTILVVSNGRPYHQIKPSLWKTLSRNPSLGRSSSPPQRTQTSVASLTGPGSDSRLQALMKRKSVLSARVATRIMTGIVARTCLSTSTRLKVCFFVKNLRKVRR